MQPSSRSDVHAMCCSWLSLLGVGVRRVGPNWCAKEGAEFLKQVALAVDPDDCDGGRGWWRSGQHTLQLSPAHIVGWRGPVQNRAASLSSRHLAVTITERWQNLLKVNFARYRPLSLPASAGEMDGAARREQHRSVHAGMEPGIRERFRTSQQAPMLAGLAEACKVL